MSDDNKKIPAVIPAKQWRKFRLHGLASPAATRVLKQEYDFEIGALDWRQLEAGVPMETIQAATERDDLKRVHAAIAILNDLLPDSDPRKITKARVEMMRRMAEAFADEDHAGNPWYISAMEFADALESYLPPVDGA